MDSSKSSWITGWTTKKFSLVILAILLTPAILTLITASLSPLPRRLGEIGIDRSLNVATTIGFWTSVISALTAAGILAARIGSASPWSVLLSLFSIVVFFTINIAICLCGCGLDDSMRN